MSSVSFKDTFLTPPICAIPCLAHAFLSINYYYWQWLLVFFYFSNLFCYSNVFSEGRLKLSATPHHIWGTKLGSALVQKKKINGNNIISCDINDEILTAITVISGSDDMSEQQILSIAQLFQAPKHKRGRGFGLSSEVNAASSAAILLQE